MTLRPARPEDAAGMAMILSDWIDETPWMPRLHSRDGDLNFLTRQVPRSVVVVKRGAVAGFLTRNAEEIECLYVGAVHRSAGVGRTLMQHAQSLSPLLRLWTFQENSGARQFYCRAGFVEVEQSEGAGNAENLPDVRFEWRRGEVL